MKQLTLCGLAMIAGFTFFTSCSKKSSDVSSLSVQQTQAGAFITSDTLQGSIKGTLQTGKTYYLIAPVTINATDTVVMQSGVTIDVVNPAAYILVKGMFVSLGTKAAPNWITVKSITKEDNINTSQNPSTDPAFTSPKLWCGIACDTMCKMLVLKWTHLEFAGGNYATTPPVSSLNGGAASWPIYFSNPNGYCIVEDSWLYGGTDDGVRFAGGKIAFLRNTVEKEGYIGGDVFNAKHGTVGIMAYNLFVGTATNGTKASDKGSGGSPTCDIDMYNNTYINGGYRQVETGRSGAIDYEQGAYGQAYNNLLVNCKFGFRIVSNPIADTAKCFYGYTYQYGDADSLVDQFYPVGYITVPKSTDIPAPTYLPAGYTLGAVYDAPSLVHANNPMFVNYTLPASAGAVTDYATGFDFHLQSTSPAVGKGHTSWTPIANPVPLDASYGATELTAPGIDIGCYQQNGTGNQH